MSQRDEYRTERRDRQPSQRSYDERRGPSNRDRGTGPEDRRRQYDRDPDRRAPERDRAERNAGRNVPERSRDGRQPSSKGEHDEMQRRRRINEKKKKAKRNRLILILAAACVVVIVIIIIAVSCGNDAKRQAASAEVAAPDVETQAGEEIITVEETAEGETAVAVADIINEKPVNLYTMDYNTMTCNKVTELNKTWSVSEDLEAFGAFATSDSSFTFSSETQAHQDTWNAVQTSTTYKIGYELSFEVNGEQKVITILKPGDIEDNADLYNGDYPESGDYSGITGYMGVWVYDDINQDGGYYIHITQAEVTDATLLTSIKLRPTPQSDQISNLVLKAFSYSSTAEFDANGHYIGNYAASVTINKQ